MFLEGGGGQGQLLSSHIWLDGSADAWMRQLRSAIVTPPFFRPQVGSTGVGALTVAFLILAVSTIVFLAKANGSGVQRKYYYRESRAPAVCTALRCWD